MMCKYSMHTCTLWQQLSERPSPFPAQICTISQQGLQSGLYKMDSNYYCVTFTPFSRSMKFNAVACERNLVQCAVQYIQCDSSCYVLHFYTLLLTAYSAIYYGKHRIPIFTTTFSMSTMGMHLLQG